MRPRAWRRIAVMPYVDACSVDSIRVSLSSEIRTNAAALCHLCPTDKPQYSADDGRHGRACRHRQAVWAEVAGATEGARILSGGVRCTRRPEPDVRERCRAGGTEHLTQEHRGGREDARRHDIEAGRWSVSVGASPMTSGASARSRGRPSASCLRCSAPSPPASRSSDTQARSVVSHVRRPLQ